MADKFNMSDVMISYSRRDKAFVQQLEQALREDGMEVWVDWEDIPPTANWWAEIEAGIEAAHSFVFIITPAAVRSEVCRREVEYAVKHNKRLVPILHEELSADDKAFLLPALSAHNWIYFRKEDHFRRAFLVLRATLKMDLEHKQMHTRLLVRAGEWTQTNRKGSLLLRGDDLRAAEKWLLQSLNASPQPLPEQVEYVQASRRAARRFGQRVFGAFISILTVMSLLLLFAFGQSERANTQAQTALYEANLRATQERLVIDSVAAAATSQQIENDSAAAAMTAQGRVHAAQTQAAQALLDSGNSLTRAYVAQQNVLTATLLQGEAQILAQQAQLQQTQSGAAALQAQGQANLAQGQANQAATQGALAATQGAELVNQAGMTAAYSETEAAIKLSQATAVIDEAATVVFQAEGQVTQVWYTPTALHIAVGEAEEAASAAEIELAEFELWAYGDEDTYGEEDGEVDRTRSIAENAERSMYESVRWRDYYDLYVDLGVDGTINTVTASEITKLRDACLQQRDNGLWNQMSAEAISICSELIAPPTEVPFELSTSTPMPTDTPVDTATVTETPTPTMTLPATSTEIPPENPDNAPPPDGE
ncbi:MAG: toll/interleukin-1 receptor domain-containing protein [Anaerolineae bacterium]|nr:toll/interleukin-1 receptor domain-containing protein [Anaerolineae bacterium]